MDILISGASVAGPALAHWLRRYGFSTTIVERAPRLRDGGHAVDFRGRAHLSVLRQMGILDEVERNRTGMGAMSYVNAAGRKLGSIPADLFAGDVEILRGDLARILSDAADVEYLFDDSVTSLAEDAQGVTVTFERHPARRFDLVIGADGLHSNVRALTFGPESQFVRHLGVHCAVFPLDNYLDLDHTGLAYRPAGKMVAVYSARHNAEARAMFLFGSPPLTYDRRDVTRQKTLLAEAFAGVGWETATLLDRMWDAPDFYFDSVAQIRLDRWSKGRVALLGDAAYSPCLLSGMGSGLAIVGAYVLAGELAAARGDHRVAFDAYERVMRPYAESAQKSGEGVSKLMVPEGKVVTALLNQYMRIMPYLPGKQMAATMARKTAEAITLPDYQHLRTGVHRP
ncbi:FAD-dependent oxidoreductase [Longispora fulva]|uniref:2-polyprenyl-6-methoxyphenol hydroxylase-like FAD-dependent oxidoreductase n=1 Tax=Longispora fulva TaxID=619741 RepID=A0A8J7GGX4_9ACTN|nr:FAD-dependent monooxygenase [Longispora fulva]MBG6136850.1 2-polyprenyl-6-methoxyphenol hydroxylase-like FAD-dependent oxidoreductase [Longispora fulva]GIG60021.1 FAD-dependent oxidoreductase [Longispora fulva]